MAASTLSYGWLPLPAMVHYHDHHHHHIMTAQTLSHLPAMSALLVRLTPATSSATPRSTTYQGYTSCSRVWATLFPYVIPWQLVLSPSLPRFGPWGLHWSGRTLLKYDGRFRATFTSIRPCTVDIMCCDSDRQNSNITVLEFEGSSFYTTALSGYAVTKCKLLLLCFEQDQSSHVQCSYIKSLNAALKVTYSVHPSARILWRPV